MIVRVSSVSSVCPKDVYVQRIDDGLICRYRRLVIAFVSG